MFQETQKTQIIFVLLLYLNKKVVVLINQNTNTPFM